MIQMHIYPIRPLVQWAAMLLLCYIEWGWGQRELLVLFCTLHLPCLLRLVHFIATAK